MGEGSASLRCLLPICSSFPRCQYWRKKRRKLINRQEGIHQLCALASALISSFGFVPGHVAACFQVVQGVDLTRNFVSARPTLPTWVILKTPKFPLSSSQAIKAAASLGMGQNTDLISHRRRPPRQTWRQTPGQTASPGRQKRHIRVSQHGAVGGRTGRPNGEVFCVFPFQPKKGDPQKETRTDQFAQFFAGAKTGLAWLTPE